MTVAEAATAVAAARNLLDHAGAHLAQVVAAGEFRIARLPEGGKALRLAAAAAGWPETGGVAEMSTRAIDAIDAILQVLEAEQAHLELEVRRSTGTAFSACPPPCVG